MYIAVKCFYHNKQYKRGDVVKIGAVQASKMLRTGLIVEVDNDPPEAVGTQSFALPPAQVLPQATAPKSKRGRKKKVVELSQSIPASE